MCCSGVARYPTRRGKEGPVKGSGNLSLRTWRTLTMARHEKATQGGGNAYNLREIAGAFGDLGTLIPFLIGYITISNQWC